MCRGNSAGRWNPQDLSDRLCRSLDLAIVALDEFGKSGYVDTNRPLLNFGAEKVVAESAMLAHAAAGSGNDLVDARIRKLCEHLVPLARAPWVLSKVSLHPAQAFKFSVPHVLLTGLGYRDQGVDDFLHARCERAAMLGNDLPSSAIMEHAWMAQLWGRSMPIDWPTAASLLESSFDVFGEREDAYALTHQLFYATDFGRSRAPLLTTDNAERLLKDVEAVLLRSLDAEDYDLAGELLMTWPQLGVEWSPAAAFGFRVLARIEDEVGVLPCANLDLARLDSLEGSERRRYALATGYHTAFVMGFLCAVALRCGPPPTLIVDSSRLLTPWRERYCLISRDQGHWQDDFDRAAPLEQDALAHVVRAMEISQKMRVSDYQGLGEALTWWASRAEVSQDPLWLGAADRLMALENAASLTTNAAETHDRRWVSDGNA